MKSLAKISYFILIAFIFMKTNVNAQCTPASSLPSQGIFPDTFTSATVNEPYNQVIQFKINADTVFSGMQAKVDSLRILNVTGMPPGFSYNCNKPGCNALGGEIACALFSGTTAQAGLYPLQVVIQVKGRVNLLGAWIAGPTQYDTNTAYSIRVNYHAGIFEVVNHAEPLKVFPNPAKQILKVNTSMFRNDKVNIRVFDITGKLFMTVISEASANTVIDISKLPEGLFTIEANDGLNSYRAKFFSE